VKFTVSFCFSFFPVSVCNPFIKEERRIAIFAIYEEGLGRHFLCSPGTFLLSILFLFFLIAWELKEIQIYSRLDQSNLC
jgi:hypothetical protein